MCLNDIILGDVHSNLWLLRFCCKSRFCFTDCWVSLILLRYVCSLNNCIIPPVVLRQIYWKKIACGSGMHLINMYVYEGCGNKIVWVLDVEKSTFWFDLNKIHCIIQVLSVVFFTDKQLVPVKIRCSPLAYIGGDLLITDKENLKKSDSET